MNANWYGWYLVINEFEEGRYPYLRHDTLILGGYDIDLLTMTSSAQMLDWIFQASPRMTGGLEGSEMLAGLVQALDDIFQPQANLCSGGRSKRLSRRRILALVAAAWEKLPDRPAAARQPACGPAGP
jgi:hypothetical protein